MGQIQSQFFSRKNPRLCDRSWLNTDIRNEMLLDKYRDNLFAKNIEKKTDPDWIYRIFEVKCYGTDTHSIFFKCHRICDRSRLYIDIGNKTSIVVFSPLVFSPLSLFPARSFPLRFFPLRFFPRRFFLDSFFCSCVVSVCSSLRSR